MPFVRTLRRGLFVLMTSSVLFACYTAPAYCHRAWVRPHYGYAGYWRCV